MNANFTVLTKTTPTLANALVYHLQQTLKGLPLQGNHILTSSVGSQVEVRISQTFHDRMRVAA